MIFVVKKYTKENVDKRNSDYVCFDCGHQFLTPKQLQEGGVSTAHTSHCGLCGQTKSVIHIRNWNWLRIQN